MAYSLKKIWAAMAVSLVAVTSTVSALDGQFGGGYGYDGQSWEGPCQTSCPCPCPSMNNGQGNVFFTAEALFFRAHEDGLGFAASFDNSTDINFNPVDDLTIENPHFNWDTGVRVGVGYKMGCDCWDVAAYYTYFRTKAHGSAYANPFDANDFVIPLWGTFQGLNTATSVHAKWRLHIDLADFELGREFCISPCVTLRPFIGVRGAWIQQTYSILAQDATTASFNDGFVASQSDKFYTKFEGVGIRTGLDSQWNLGCGLSLYGCASTSILYGRIHSRSNESDLFLSDVTSGDIDAFTAAQHDQRHGCRYIADAAVGLRWKHSMCDDSVLFTVQVGWENRIFFDQNRLEDFVGQVAVGNLNPQVYRGDLCLQGWTLGAKVDF